MFLLLFFFWFSSGFARCLSLFIRFHPETPSFDNTPKTSCEAEQVAHQAVRRKFFLATTKHKCF